MDGLIMIMNMKPTGNTETKMDEFNSPTIDHIPDRWIVITFTGDDGVTCDRVLAGWVGGYLGSDSWQLNSGIERVEDCGDYYLFHGFSGSVYKCFKAYYGMTAYTSTIFGLLEKRFKIEIVKSYDNQ